MQPIRVPPALQNVDAEELESYVELRIKQLLTALFHAHPDLSQAISGEDFRKALSLIPKPQYNIPQLQQRDLQLLFRHDCQ